MSQKQSASGKASNTRRSERKRRNYRANLDRRYRLHAQRCKLIRSDLKILETQLEGMPLTVTTAVERFDVRISIEQVKRALRIEETKRAKCERLIDGRRS